MKQKMKWIEEATQLEGRYTRYIDGIKNEHIRFCTTVLLENQRLFLEALGDKTEEYSTDFCLELVSKVYPNLVIHKIGHCIPMLGPMITINSKNEIAAYTKKLKTTFTSDDSIDETAKSIIKELDEEHLSDIHNNVGTILKAEIDTDTDMYVKLHSLFDTMYRKTLNNANFIAVNEKIYNKFKSQFDSFNKEIVLLTNWNLATILVGYSGKDVDDSSYFFTPYIPFAYNSPPVDLGFAARKGMLMRYGKKLVEGGSRNYGKLELV